MSHTAATITDIYRCIDCLYSAPGLLCRTAVFHHALAHEGSSRRRSWLTIATRFGCAGHLTVINDICDCCINDIVAAGKVDGPKSGEIGDSIGRSSPIEWPGLKDVIANSGIVRVAHH